MACVLQFRGFAALDGEPRLEFESVDDAIEHIKFRYPDAVGSVWHVDPLCSPNSKQIWWASDADKFAEDGHELVIASLHFQVERKHGEE